MHVHYVLPTIGTCILDIIICMFTLAAMSKFRIQAFYHHILNIDYLSFINKKISYVLVSWLDSATTTYVLVHMTNFGALLSIRLCITLCQVECVRIEVCFIIILQAKSLMNGIITERVL